MAHAKLGRMIKKTFLVFLSSVLFLVFAVGCSSEGSEEKTALKQSVALDEVNATLKAAGTSEAIAVDGRTGAALDAGGTTVAAAKKAKYDPYQKYGSLWNSELFNDERFKLNIVLTPSEKKEARILARSFESHMGRAKLFMHYLLSELKERNLPVELAAIPLVESGFNLRARSHAGAHGPWQFTRQTGKSFGLEVSAHYDEFYDFVASTQASLDYLEHLYSEFHNWDFALIAYNQGEFGVKKVIRRAKQAGVKNLTVQNMGFTKMGRIYLKRIRAYADIMHHPKSYGVEYPEIENRAVFERVQIAGRLSSMKEAAKLSGADLDTLKLLNAGYLTDTLKSKKPHGLLVPVENVAQLERALGISKETSLPLPGVKPSSDTELASAAVAAKSQLAVN